jgi:hypothetical protein
MPEFQLLRCEIALAGDLGNTVVRHRGNPITYPELELIQFMHGDEAVFDIHVVGTCEMSNDQMLDRLRVIYREDDVKAVFSGAKPRLPPGDPTLPICTQPVFIAPPTRPDSPDPRLKPLSSYPIREITDRPKVVLDPASMPAEVDPTPDEIAAHAQDEDDPGLDPVVMGLGDVVMPDVNDQLRTPENVSSRRNPPRQAGYLPDVASRPPPTTKRDPDRPKG